MLAGNPTKLGEVEAFHDMLANRDAEVATMVFVAIFFEGGLGEAIALEGCTPSSRFGETAFGNHTTY